jgi:hypothetical protein
LVYSSSSIGNLKTQYSKLKTPTDHRQHHDGQHNNNTNQQPTTIMDHANNKRK